MSIPTVADDEHIPPEELSRYGVDWPELDSRHVMEHHNRANTHDMDDISVNPSPSRRPPHLSLVEVPQFDCPLTSDEVDIFNDNIIVMQEYYSRNMDDRKRLWGRARALIRAIASI
ncbi:hypothetical protein BDZ89DRAFT_1145403 [Hymenopellis radicata]|nr:hypothetical protein BDZ89DRAFT_1145403 [Hymenopellis radicata]